MKTFIISDHLDFKGLVEFIESVNPKKVYTFHGFSIELADYLNKIGIKAFPLI
jgi:Cft2 family RNA processing exonuclease